MFSKKNIILTFATSVLAMIGTIAIVTPSCIGWFYQPQLPEELKDLKK